MAFYFRIWTGRKEDISLWVVKSEMCPAVNCKVEIKLGLVEKIITFLQAEGILNEISKGERHIWPYEPHYIHVRNLSDVMERNG